MSRYRRIPDRDADDFVQEAIIRLLDGKRHWDPERVDLFGLLCGAIYGLITNHAAGPYVRRRHSTEEGTAPEQPDKTLLPDDLVWMEQMMRTLEGCEGKSGCNLRRLYDIARAECRLDARTVSERLGLSYDKAKRDVARFRTLLRNLGQVAPCAGAAGCPLGDACWAHPGRKPPSGAA